MKYGKFDVDGQPIGILDSGIGGVSTLMAIRQKLPKEKLLYANLKKFVAFGNMSEHKIFRESASLVDKLMQSNCKAIVIACNTATNVGVGNLRIKYKIPFIGCEPAIKPAVESGCKNILVLVTVATSRQSKFLNLVGQYNLQANIEVAPQQDLARLIETSIAGISLKDNLNLQKYSLPDNFYCDLQLQLRQHVWDILDKYPHVDGIVLGCTHYIFLSQIIKDYFESCNKVVRLFDGNEGISNRLKCELSVDCKS